VEAKTKATNNERKKIMAWILIGEVRGIIKRPVDAPGSKFQVQILAAETMKNGEIRESIHTIGTDTPAKFEQYMNKQIMLEASPWAKKDGGLGISVADSAKVSSADHLLDTRA
jgi:hypothetical protein